MHRICAYQGSFPPQLPAYFLEGRPPGIFLDPFCGRGTALLEASIRGWTVAGNDLMSVARALSAVKVRCAPRETVLAEIAALDLSAPAPELPERFAPFYHPSTWAQLWCLREARRSPELTALALGRMHGHSPGFFSGFTFNVVSLQPERAAALQAKHGTSAPPRDVKSILVQAARRFIPETGLEGEGIIINRDARDLAMPLASVDLVITSPPFFDVIDYEDANWLRRWFLGDDGPSIIADNAIAAPGAYVAFLSEVLSELARVVKPGGHVVFEVGPVKGKHQMSALVIEAATSFRVIETLVNDFSEDGVPKISRAMGGGKKTTTMQNQCVVLGLS